MIPYIDSFIKKFFFCLFLYFKFSPVFFTNLYKSSEKVAESAIFKLTGLGYKLIHLPETRLWDSSFFWQITPNLFFHFFIEFLRNLLNLRSFQEKITKFNNLNINISLSTVLGYYFRILNKSYVFTLLRLLSRKQYRPTMRIFSNLRLGVFRRML